MSDKTMKCTDWQHDLLNSTAAGCPTCHEPAYPSAPERTLPTSVQFSLRRLYERFKAVAVNQEADERDLQFIENELMYVWEQHCDSPAAPACPQAAQLPAYPIRYALISDSLMEKHLWVTAEDYDALRSAPLSEVDRLKEMLEDVIRRKNHYNEAYCEIDDKMEALQAELPLCEGETLLGAIRNLRQANVLNEENCVTLEAEVERLKEERDNWRRKYFEMERAQSRSIDQNGEHIKRIQRLERDQDEIRNDSTVKLSSMQAELAGSQKKMDALVKQLTDIRNQVINGRLCYFGDHTGYEPQFSSEQVERWSAAIALAEERAKQ